MCVEGATRELFEESWGTYIVFRVTSMPSCRCVPLGAARRNRPSRRRRSHGCRLRGTSSDTLTSPGCRFWNWPAVSSSPARASQGPENGEDRFERHFPRAYHAQPTFTSARRRFCSISFHFHASALLKSERAGNFREYQRFGANIKSRDYICGLRSGAVVCPAPIRSHGSETVRSPIRTSFGILNVFDASNCENVEKCPPRGCSESHAP